MKKYLLIKYRGRILFIVLFLPILFSTLNAQEEYYDTIRLDETVKSDTIRMYSKSHSPGRAILYSAIVPGLGQAYNRKYWKIPIIYGAGALFYFFYDYNNFYLQRVKNAWTELDQEGVISDPDLAGYSKEDLELNLSVYHKATIRPLLFMGLLYFANIIDAMVDAYLFTYDVSNDLTLDIEPAIFQYNNYSDFASTSAGLTLCFRF